MFCPKCGTEVRDDDVFCPKCGAKLAHEQQEAKQEVRQEVVSNRPRKRNKDLCTVALVFCVINCVIVGFALIPLIWMIPMTVSLNNKLKNDEEISVVFKVCTLLFLSLIGGILLLVADEDY